MAEYINKETLYAELDSKLDGRPMEDTVPWLLCMSIVRKFPAADVVERKKGKWEKVYYGNRPNRCSECRQKNNYRTNFCPNCGADMREKT